jgi:DNA repair exonuclease SbcCD nuclease subunit
MVKFLHAADIHLDSRLDGLQRYDSAPVERIKNAARAALENLVDLAMEEEVAFVLLAGDIYDGDWPDYNTGLYFGSQMARLREAGIRVFLIAGNHDATNKMTRILRLPANVTMFGAGQPESHVLDDLGIVIHGQSFATGAVTEDLSRQYPPAIPGLFNIGLLHTCIEGAEGHDRYAPCTAQGLRSRGYDYWALGHIHKRDLISTNPHIVYPGNIQGRHIRETGPKGCMLVGVADLRLAEFEFRRLDVVRWETCSVAASDVAGEDALYDRAVNQIAQLLGPEEPHRLLVVRVLFQGKSKLHDRLLSDPVRCAAEVRNRAIILGADRVWVEQVKVQTRPWSDQIGPGPLEELLAGLSELRASEEQLRQQAQCLGDLRDKLPPEFLRLPEAPRLDDRAWLLQVLDEVEALLRSRLSQSESGR